MDKESPGPSGCEGRLVALRTSDRTAREYPYLTNRGKEVIESVWKDVLLNIPKTASIDEIRRLLLPAIDRLKDDYSRDKKFCQLMERSFTMRLKHLEKVGILEEINASGSPIGTIANQIRETFYPGKSGNFLNHAYVVRDIIAPQVADLREKARKWLTENNVSPEEHESVLASLENQLSDIVVEWLKAIDPREKSGSRKQLLQGLIYKSLKAKYEIPEHDDDNNEKAINALCKDSLNTHEILRSEIPYITASDIQATTRGDNKGNWRTKLGTSLRLALTSLLVALGLSGPVTANESQAGPVLTSSPRAQQIWEADWRSLSDSGIAYVSSDELTTGYIPATKAFGDPEIAAEDARPYPIPENKISPFLALGPINLEKPFTFVVNEEVARKVSDTTGLETKRVFLADVKVNEDSTTLPLNLIRWLNDWKRHPNAALILRTNWPSDNAILCHAGIGFPCDWVSRLPPDQIIGQEFQIVQRSEVDGGLYSVRLRAVGYYELTYYDLFRRIVPAQSYTKDGLAFFQADDPYTDEDSSGELARRLWPEHRDGTNTNERKFIHFAACVNTNGNGWDGWRVIVLAEIPNGVEIAIEGPKEKLPNEKTTGPFR